MQAQFFKPHPSLQHLVHNIMVSGNKVPMSQESLVTPFPPLPQHALYFYIHDPVDTQFFGETQFRPSPKCMIIGPQLMRVNIKMGHNNLVARVGFQPGALHRLVKFPMHDILDYVCDGEDVFGNVVNEVHEKLNEAKDAIAIKNEIEKFLMQQQAHAESPFTSAITQLVNFNGNVSIAYLASQAGLSTRQFERRCNKYIGLPPKLFARITRFSKAYRMHQKFPQLTWTAIAYQCGYFDQMHFIRDFKEFAGVTPGFMEHELSLTPFRLQSNIFS
ncbi:helix-turn-helix domain-containing protein [Mucilaginibacter sp.]